MIVLIRTLNGGTESQFPDSTRCRIIISFVRHLLLLLPRASRQRATPALRRGVDLREDAAKGRAHRSRRLERHRRRRPRLYNRRAGGGCGGGCSGGCSGGGGRPQHTVVVVRRLQPVRQHGCSGLHRGLHHLNPRLYRRIPAVRRRRRGHGWEPETLEAPPTRRPRALHDGGCNGAGAGRRRRWRHPTLCRVGWRHSSSHKRTLFCSRNAFTLFDDSQTDSQYGACNRSDTPPGSGSNRTTV
jgi:hypothetical protein